MPLPLHWYPLNPLKVDYYGALLQYPRSARENKMIETRAKLCGVKVKKEENGAKGKKGEVKKGEKQLGTSGGGDGGKDDKKEEKGEKKKGEDEEKKGMKFTKEQDEEIRQWRGKPWKELAIKWKLKESDAGLLKTRSKELAEDEGKKKEGNTDDKEVGEKKGEKNEDTKNGKKKKNGKVDGSGDGDGEEVRSFVDPGDYVPLTGKKAGKNGVRDNKNDEDHKKEEKKTKDEKRNDGKKDKRNDSNGVFDEEEMELLRNLLKADKSSSNKDQALRIASRFADKNHWQPSDDDVAEALGL